MGRFRSNPAKIAILKQLSTVFSQIWSVRLSFELVSPDALFNYLVHYFGEAKWFRKCSSNFDFICSSLQSRRLENCLPGSSIQSKSYPWPSCRIFPGPDRGLNLASWTVGGTLSVDYFSRENRPREILLSPGGKNFVNAWSQTPELMPRWNHAGSRAAVSSFVTFFLAVS